MDVTYFVNGGQPIKKQHRVRPASPLHHHGQHRRGPGPGGLGHAGGGPAHPGRAPHVLQLRGEMDGGHIVMGSPYSPRTGTWPRERPSTLYRVHHHPEPERCTGHRGHRVLHSRDSGAHPTPTPWMPTPATPSNAGIDCGLDAEVSVYLHSNLPILVERPMYFNHAGRGAAGWALRRGRELALQRLVLRRGIHRSRLRRVASPYRTPAGIAANLTVTYYVVGGMPITRNHTVLAALPLHHRRGGDAGDDLDLSAYVHSTSR